MAHLFRRIVMIRLLKSGVSATSCLALGVYRSGQKYFRDPNRMVGVGFAGAPGLFDGPSSNRQSCVPLGTQNSQTPDGGAGAAVRSKRCQGP